MIGPRVRAGSVLVLTFVAGMLAGVFLDRHRPVAAPPPPVSPETRHAAAMAELREALDLDDEQVEAIHAILADRQETVQRMWEQLRPEMQAAMRQVHNDIAALLRPDQRQRFHEWLQSQSGRATVLRLH